METPNLHAGDCILTYSGHYLNVFDPNPDHICIEDIAHALSHIPRFAGHLIKPLSVARHSIRVAELVPKEFMMEALLHDASEAYLMDIPKPIKRHLPDYIKLENQLMKVIADKFGFSFPMSQIVKEADKEMLEREHHQMRVMKAEGYPVTTAEEDKGNFMFSYLYVKESDRRRTQLKNHANYSLSDDWTEPVDGVISMPDHLDPLLNKIATQLRFHTISGKNEQSTLIHMVRISEQFFLDPAKKKTGKEVTSD